MIYLDLMSRYKIKVKGKEAWISCPFHIEREPSMSVNLETGGFYCFGCKRGPGEWLDALISELEGISLMQANLMITKATLTARPKMNGARKQYDYIQESVFENFFPISSKPYIDYLTKERRISKAVALDFDVREGNASDRDWNNRIIYAIRDKKKRIASIEGRTINNDSLRHRNWSGSKTSLGLFGIERFKKKVPWLFVVEAPIDCMSLAMIKVPAVAMCTSTLSKMQVEMLYKTVDYPIILLDGVRKGTEHAREEVVEKIRKEMFGYFQSEYGIHTIRRQNTDPNDLLKKGALKHYIDNVLRENKLKRGKIQWQEKRVVNRQRVSKQVREKSPRKKKASKR